MGSDDRKSPGQPEWSRGELTGARSQRACGRLDHGLQELNFLTVLGLSLALLHEGPQGVNRRLLRALPAADSFL